MKIASNLVNIKHLVSEQACYQTVRDLRWPKGVHCPDCSSADIIRRGKHCSNHGTQKTSEPLKGEVEFDEVYVVAGHKRAT